MAGSDFFFGEALTERTNRAEGVPLFGAETSFDWMHTAVGDGVGSCCYYDAATCPDCSSGMVRLGTCFSCPVCGWGGCG